MQQELGIWSKKLLTEYHPKSSVIFNSTGVLYLYLDSIIKKFYSSFCLLLYPFTALGSIEQRFSNWCLQMVMDHSSHQPPPPWPVATSCTSLRTTAIENGMSSSITREKYILLYLTHAVWFYVQQVEFLSRMSDVKILIKLETDPICQLQLNKMKMSHSGAVNRAELWAVVTRMQITCTALSSVSGQPWTIAICQLVVVFTELLL